MWYEISLAMYTAAADTAAVHLVASHSIAPSRIQGGVE